MNILEVLPHIGFWVQDHWRLAVLGAGGLFVVGTAANLATRSKRTAPLTTHGTARWSTPKERRQAGLSTTHGVVIGEVDGLVYCDDWVTHVLTVGRTRSGKGYFHIRPTLRWFWRQSALILDPKNGENFLATHAERAQMGRVEVFAPHTDSPTQLNVTDSIRFGAPTEYRDALSIGKSLTAPPPAMKGPSHDHPHFRELASEVLAAAQLHVWYTTKHCSLAHVWHFMTQQPGSTQGKKLEGFLGTLRSTMHVSQGVHQSVLSISNAMSVMGEREWGSVWSTATRPLYLYNDFYIAKATDTSSMALRDLQCGPEVVSLYLTGESPIAVMDMHQVYRVVIDTTLQVLMRREEGQRPEEVDHRLLLCLDELPLYGYIPTLAAQVATMAGYGIKGWFLAQDIPQLDETYGKNSAIWGNTDTKLFHAPGNDDTAERISDMLGDATIEYQVQSQGGGMRGQGTVTPHRTRRALKTSDEITNMSPAQGIACTAGRGLYPFEFGKLGFDPHYKEPEKE
jgi:type IV secretion system protein VirD4